MFGSVLEKKKALINETSQLELLEENDTIQPQQMQGHILKKKSWGARDQE